MNKIKEFFIDFFKTRNVAFYIALGFAGLAFIGGIIASAGTKVAGGGALPAVLTMLGLFAFFGLSLVKHEWAGAGVAAAMSFVSIVVSVCDVYSFYLSAVSDMSMTGISVSKVLALGGIGSLITSLIFFAICAIALTALAWIRMRKKPVIINATEENENVNE